MGIDYEEKAFYDILVSCAKKFHFENQYPDEKMKNLAKKVKELVDDKTRYTDWDVRIDVKAELEADLMILLDENGYEGIILESFENIKQDTLSVNPDLILLDIKIPNKANAKKFLFFL
mgnify:CR=1 FL=1